MHVVLVHGFLNRGAIMSGLAEALEEAGHPCHLPTLRPIDGRGGLPRMAEKLRAYIDATLDPGELIALVGFSMGALIARFYLQELSGRERTRLFVSVAGPHAGTRMAYLYPSQGVCDMRPGSAFLRRLETSADKLRGLPIVSYWTPHDLMVRPVKSACWQVGETVEVPARMHFLMVYDHRLRQDLAQRLRLLSNPAC